MPELERTHMDFFTMTVMTSSLTNPLTTLLNRLYVTDDRMAQHLQRGGSYAAIS